MTFLHYASRLHYLHWGCLLNVPALNHHTCPRLREILFELLTWHLAGPVLFCLCARFLLELLAGLCPSCLGGSLYILGICPSYKSIFVIHGGPLRPHLCLCEQGDSEMGLAMPERPTMWLEIWGFEPCDILIAWFLRKREGLKIESWANDSMNHAYVMKPL